MSVLFTALLIAALTALAWIDLKTFRLPDVLTLPLLFLGLFQAWALSSNWQASLIGAALGYTAFVAIEIGFRRLRGKDGLGRGDAKLLAAGGAWCGWAGLPFIVLIASGSGLIALLFPPARKWTKTGRIPFGPFLAFGIGTVWIARLLVS